MALFLSGPLYCWWLSRKDHEVDGRWLYKQIADSVTAEKEILQGKIRDQERSLQAKIAQYQDEIQKSKAQHAGLLADNQRLRATVEFSSEVPKPLQIQRKRAYWMVICFNAGHERYIHTVKECPLELKSGTRCNS